jgi:hypothetical protein
MSIAFLASIFSTHLICSGTHGRDSALILTDCVQNHWYIASGRSNSLQSAIRRALYRACLWMILCIHLHYISNKHQAQSQPTSWNLQRSDPNHTKVPTDVLAHSNNSKRIRFGPHGCAGCCPAQVTYCVRPLCARAYRCVCLERVGKQQICEQWNEQGWTINTGIWSHSTKSVTKRRLQIKLQFTYSVCQSTWHVVVLHPTASWYVSEILETNCSCDSSCFRIGHEFGMIFSNAQNEAGS